MFSCSPCTCCITGCVATCQIGHEIGSIEAVEMTSCKGQSLNLLNQLCPCFPCICPEYYPGAYQQKLLEMTKDNLGFTYYPNPAGLPLVSGNQLTLPYSSSCAMCLMLAELKAHRRHDPAEGDGKSAVVGSLDTQKV